MLPLQADIPGGGAAPGRKTTQCFQPLAGPIVATGQFNSLYPVKATVGAESMEAAQMRPAEMRSQRALGY